MSKKMVFFVGLILLSFVSSGFCWTQSFRSNASGGLFWGDFDNDLDPIFIFDNEGYRLYSSFSNLSSSGDRFFSNGSDGIYLFGISGFNGLPRPYRWESRTAFIIQLADTRSDAASGLDTNYDGVIDIAGDGFMAGDFTQIIDVNDDNIYDTRVNIASTGDNFDLLKRRDWQITHSYKIGSSTMGLVFSHFGYGNNASENNRSSGLLNYVVPLQSFSYTQNLTQIDLATSDVVDQIRETGDFLTTYQTPSNVLEIAVEFPFGPINNSELRLDFSYNNSKNEYKVSDLFDYYRDVSSGGIVGINSQTESIEVDSSLSGSLISPGVLLTKHWNSDNYSWFRVSVGFGSYDADMTISDNYDVENIFTGPTGNLETVSRDYDDLTLRKGETERKRISFFHKTNVKFTQNLSFAIGLGYLRNSDDTDWRQDYTLSHVFSYDNGDNVQDHSDSVSLVTESARIDLSNETISNNVNLPVAIEYALGKWTFRLGAIHQIVRVSEEENRRIVESQPRRTTTTYGDGEVVIEVEDDEFLSRRTATETRSHHNEFIYGLEFKANKNLKAELLGFLNDGTTGFLDTEFYRDLRLSITILF
ncbi:MAG: hypothetical protein JSW64_09540 [Candidatus Zixiibacteriota bacterium]|nr:MAG: hypothetical protein JSW64_09540 [candidate division Zixibacteria bacterium]